MDKFRYNIQLPDVESDHVLYIYPPYFTSRRKRGYNPFGDASNNLDTLLVPGITGDKRQRVIVLSLNKPPRDILTGWIFGTDPVTCDVVLKNPDQNSETISRNHFVVGFNHESGILTIKNCSRNGTCYSSDCRPMSATELRGETAILGKQSVIVFETFVVPMVCPQTQSSDQGYQKALSESLNKAFTAKGLNNRFNTAVTPIVPLDLRRATKLDGGLVAGDVIHTVRHAGYHVSVIIQASTGKKQIAKVFENDGIMKHNHDEEIRLLQNLKHDNIIGANVWSDLDNTYAIMPCARGALSDSHGVPWGYSRKIAVATQLITGLEYLHSCGIAHCDIKPENIFIFSLAPIYLKIGDFGSATKKRTTTRKVGTLVWAAPEICLGHYPAPGELYKPLPYSTQLTDMWSFGVVLMRCAEKVLTPRPFVWGKYQETLAERAASMGVESDILSYLITHTVKLSPNERLTAQECREVLQGGPVPEGTLASGAPSATGSQICRPAIAAHVHSQDAEPATPRGATLRKDTEPVTPQGANLDFAIIAAALQRPAKNRGLKRQREGTLALGAPLPSMAGQVLTLTATGSQICRPDAEPATPRAATLRKDTEPVTPQGAKQDFAIIAKALQRPVKKNKGIKRL